MTRQGVNGCQQVSEATVSSVGRWSRCWSWHCSWAASRPGGSTSSTGSATTTRRAGTPAGPAAVPPPPGLELPALTDPPPVDTPVTPPGRIDPALVQAAVAPYLADPALGAHVVGVVADLTAGRPVVRFGDGAAAMPASVTKLLTTTAALSVLGPETRFTTRVVAGGKKRIVLVGGGDPFLASKPLPAAYPEHADVADPRRPDRGRAAAAGPDLGAAGLRRLAASPSRRSTRPGRRTTCPSTWSRGSPRSGSTRAGRPSAPGGSTTRRCTPRRPSPPLLLSHGITVVGVPTHGVAAGGRELASVQSAPLREIAARVLEVSDNEGAEVLSHQVGKAVSGSGTFADGAAAVTQTLQGLGVTADFAIHDGSGLSRENLITPLALVQVLRLTLDPGPPRAERRRHRAARGRLHRLADQPVRPAVPRLARPGAGQDRDPQPT